MEATIVTSRMWSLQAWPNLHERQPLQWECVFIEQGCLIAYRQCRRAGLPAEVASASVTAFQDLSIALTSPVKVAASQRRPSSS